MTKLIGPEQFTEIPRIDKIDARTFRKEYLGRGVPVILSGYGKQWAAHGKWSFDYFLNHSQDPALPAVVGAQHQRHVLERHDDRQCHQRSE